MRAFSVVAGGRVVSIRIQEQLCGIETETESSGKCKDPDSRGPRVSPHGETMRTAPRSLHNAARVAPKSVTFDSIRRPTQMRTHGHVPDAHAKTMRGGTQNPRK